MKHGRSCDVQIWWPETKNVALVRHFQPRVQHIWMSDSLPCIICVMLIRCRRSTAHSSKCEQCHVISWRRMLNTDFVISSAAAFLTIAQCILKWYFPYSQFKIRLPSESNHFMFQGLFCNKSCINILKRRPDDTVVVEAVIKGHFGDCAIAKTTGHWAAYGHRSTQ